MEAWRKALVLAPHTDDGELGCGGTMARLVEAGCEVRYVAFSIATRSLPSGFEPDTLAREVREATAELGIAESNLTVHDFDVRTFPERRQDILELLVALWDEWQPDVVFQPSHHDVHQDHQTIAQEGLRAFKRTTILGYEIPWNNFDFAYGAYVALEKRHIERKVAALAHYASQQHRRYTNRDYVWNLARAHDRTALIHPLDDVLPGEARVLEAAEESLAGRRRGFRGLTPFLGPAFIACVAYVDPGNFATNMAAGSGYGYLLLWVVLSANLMAMLVQSMSAKLGIATRKNLPEVCRERFPRGVSVVLWIQAELIAMATDLAEFMGAAIGLDLLFHLGLFPAALLTGVAASGILALQAKGFRRLEAVIASLIGVIVAAFALQVVMAEPSGTGISRGLFVP